MQGLQPNVANSLNYTTLMHMGSMCTDKGSDMDRAYNLPFGSELISLSLNDSTLDNDLSL